MQKTEFNKFWNLCEECSHKNQVDDEREGNVVCTDCGLILGPVYQNFIVKNDKNNNTQTSNKEEQIITTLLEVSNSPNNLEGETIELDILCNKLQLYSATKNRVFQKWEIIKKWFLDNKLKDRKILNFKKGLIIMAVYQTLIDLDMPRPMSHLCQDAGIAPKYVWYWIKLYYKTHDQEHKISILKPSSMSEYFLKPLNLSYKEIQEINKIIEENEILSYAPKTLLAASAYMFLRKNGKQCFSVKNLATTLGVSVMSVYRCLKALKK